ncbi:MAG: hypothetical protein JRN35_09430 [Nitrososphaerota archaeon]|nr:hypothetical protein [Nitrososphaerota archaeon]
MRDLQELKTGAQSWDDFLLGLAEKEMGRVELYIAETDLRLYQLGLGLTVKWSEVKKRLELCGKRK